MASVLDLFGEYNTAPEGAAPALMSVEEMKSLLDNEVADVEVPQRIIDTLLPIALTRQKEIADPTLTDTALPLDQSKMQGAAKTQATLWEANRLEAFEQQVSQMMNRYYELRGLEKANPEVAEEVGLGPEYWKRFGDAVVKAGKKGWTAVDFILRNLDRGRGSITEYMSTRQEGGTPEDAKRRAYDVLRGSSNGWVVNPQKMGPSSKQLLVKAGFDDDFVTSSVGFATDVLIAPDTWLGVGFARKAMPIDIGLMLNKNGQELLSAKLSQKVSEAGYRNISEAGADIYKIHRAAADEVKAALRDNPQLARYVLDFGGLKFAGMTLLPARFISKTRNRTSRGIVEDITTKNVVTNMFGTTFRKGADVLGEWSESSALPLPDRMREFLREAPDYLRSAGESLGLLLHRTNPYAGKRYRIMKQTAYYDKLSWQRQTTLDKLAETFKDFTTAELKQMSWAIDEGAVASLTPKQQQGVAAYQHMLDMSLADEVDRGIFRPDFPIDKRDLFRKWITDIHDPSIGEVGANAALDPKTLAQFKKIRLDNYVPHVYRNTWKAKRHRRNVTGPAPPSITEGHAFSRIFPTLKMAQEAGLVPETNLEKLAAIRLDYGSRAVATHDFLREIADEVGINQSAFTKAGEDVIRKGRQPHPTYKWQEYMVRPTTDSGLLPGSTADHERIALEIADEARVPANMVALLDDRAKRIFITEKLRSATPAAAKVFWQRYVVSPTEEGLYNGLKAAPAEDLHTALSAAKDVRDPLYNQYKYLTIVGRTDPQYLRRVLLPAPIVDDLERLRSSVLPQELHNVLRMYDWIQHTWKKSVTILWPAFHVRNKLTNIVNSSAAAGLSVLTDRPAMWNLMWGRPGSIRTDIQGLEYTNQAVIEMAHRHGVLRPLYRRTDVGEAFEETAIQRTAARRGTSIPLPGGAARAAQQQGIPNPLAHPFTAGEALAMNIENSDRLLLFVNYLKRGLNPEEAADLVNRYLFDYGDVGNIEKSIVRRIVPFWTWTRKNLALQTRLLATRPGHFGNLGRFIQNYSKEEGSSIKSDVERQLIPAWWNDTLGIRLETGQGISKMLVGLDLPQADINKLWNMSLKHTAVHEWLLQFSPYMRDIAENILQTNFYTGQQWSDLSGTRVASFVEGSPKWFREYLQYSKETIRGKETHKVNTTRWRALNLMVLFSGVGGIAQRGYSTTKNLFDPDVKASHRLFTFLTGGRVRVSRPEEELRERAQAPVFSEDLNKELRNKRRAMISGIMGSEEAGDYLNKNDTIEYPEDIALEQAILTPEEADEIDEIEFYGGF